MKICCISDTHGSLPHVEPCDMLIISGDICGHKMFREGYSPGSPQDMTFQAAWLDNEFREWIDKIAAKDIIATPGNHDFVFERARHLIPPDLRWHLLIDDLKIVQGKKVYGSPWQRFFGGWAFNAPNGDEDEVFLDRKFSFIPNDVDIVVVHGPPIGYGDVAPDGISTGSNSLLRHIKRTKPMLSVHGHIHQGRGVWEYRNNGFICNASVLNEQYQLVNKPLYFEISEETINLCR